MSYFLKPMLERKRGLVMNLGPLPAPQLNKIGPTQVLSESTLLALTPL